ncbi:MAG TPA: C40 family peptidase [Trebonia sp.]|nr:C40 family peptidase [Trebonia sp.]
MNRRVIGLLAVGVALMAMFGFLAIPMLIAGETSLLFSSDGGTGCTSTGNAPAAQQPAASPAGKSIPSDYVTWYKKVGLQYDIPWTVLAGIGTEESDNGQSTLPGVTSGTNAFGAAGPMQIGVSGASTDTWGAPPTFPASELSQVQGVATDEDGLPTVSVYDPADAIAAAAKYLNEHGYQTDPQGAIFAYNHADWYVQDVLDFASNYATGGFTVTDSAQQPGGSSTCAGNAVLDSQTVPNAAVATAISYAEQQLGKPYLWGGTGPDAFDCSGLVMMAYRSAGIYIDRTSQEQWATQTRVPASQVRPGDLVFFAGADGTPAAPGHVGLVIGGGKMIEAYATGFPIRISTYGRPTSAPGDQTVVGFTDPWAGASASVLNGSGG